LSNRCLPLLSSLFFTLLAAPALAQSPPAPNRVAIDPAYDVDHPASYNIGQDITKPGKPFFPSDGGEWLWAK
jgi:hypothetical protein